VARKPKPYLHQGWYVTGAGGKYTKLCREVEGPERAAALLADLLAGKPPAPADGLTLAAAFSLYMNHADSYYRLPSGKASNEPNCIRHAWAELLTLYGDMPAASLTRQHVAAARQRMVDRKLARLTINKSLGRIKRAIRWLVQSGHLPDQCYTTLLILENLKPHRSPAVETEEVTPVSGNDFECTLPYLTEPWNCLARLQWYSGMRPGEVCGLKLGHLDKRKGDVWYADFRKEHKMAYRGRKRVVVLGPQAIDILRPAVDRAALLGRDSVFFVTRQMRQPTVMAYDHAVARACDKAGVSRWHPNQIRHSYLTWVRENFGLDVAQAVAGHARADVTQVYAALATEKAEIAAKSPR
jgi:integrase